MQRVNPSEQKKQNKSKLKKEENKINQVNSASIIKMKPCGVFFSVFTKEELSGERKRKFYFIAIFLKRKTADNRAFCFEMLN